MDTLNGHHRDGPRDSDDDGAEDDDDPVIAEYPVFVSSDLAGCLHLFQYPMRKASNPYQCTARSLSVTAPIDPKDTDDAAAKASGVPRSLPAKSSRFFMKCKLDTTGSDSFRRKGRNGDAAGGSDDDRDLMGGGGTRTRGGNDGHEDGNEAGMLTYTLESMPTTLQSSYAVGLFVNGQVHLTPLSSIHQMVPHVTRGSGDQFLSALAADAITASTAVHSHLERQLNRLRSVVLASNSATARPLDLYESDSVESATVARRLLAPTTQVGLAGSSNYSSMAAASAGRDRSGGALATAPFKPLPDPYSHFFPLEQCGARDETFRLTRQTVLRYAHLTHSINEQVKSLLQTANLLTLRLALNHVRPLALPHLDPASSLPSLEAAVLQSLQRYAVLIHGVWVASYDTQFRGTLAFLREHVLQVFVHSPDGRISAEQALLAVQGNVFLVTGVKAILASVAELEPGTKAGARTWRLKLSSDEDLQAMHRMFPKEAEGQRAAWIRRAAEIVRNVETIKTTGKTLPNRFLKLPIQVGPGAMNTPTSGRFAAAESPVRSGAASAVPEPSVGMGGVVAPHPPSPSTLLGQSAAAPQTGAMSTEHEAEQWRQAAVKFLRLSLMAVGVVNRERMKDHLRHALQNPSCILHGCPSAIVQKAAQDVLTTFTPSTWILKSVDAATDVARRCLMTAMRNKPAFTAKDITAAAENVLNSAALQQIPGSDPKSIPPTVVTAVLKELAEYHNGERLWHVKTGMASLEPPPRGTMK
jgi:hypothetical protein